MVLPPSGQHIRRPRQFLLFRVLFIIGMYFALVAAAATVMMIPNEVGTRRLPPLRTLHLRV